MSKLPPVDDFVFTQHALAEMARRGIDKSEVSKALRNPEQMEIVRPGRVIYQIKFDLGESPKAYILRVFLDIDRKLPQVVTAYRTSKIEKYWR